MIVVAFQVLFIVAESPHIKKHTFPPQRLVVSSIIDVS